MVIDWSTLKEMFEGDNKGKAKEVNELLARMKGHGAEIRVLVPMSHFLRALYLMNPKKNVREIQKLLEYAEVVPSFANFKDEKACMDEIINIAKIASGGKDGQK